MKPSHHTSPAGTETTFTQIWTWAQELDPCLRGLLLGLSAQNPVAAHWPAREES
jgi:hypothetical protein